MEKKKGMENKREWNGNEKGMEKKKGKEKRR